MKSDYKEIHRQADRLQHRFGAIADQPNIPEMRDLQRQMRDVMEAVESDKAPQAIEERIKAVLQTLHGISNQESQTMGHADADSLRADYEDLRNDVRKL